MASRYGRNQRRAHRAEIERLNEQLEGGWVQPEDVSYGGDIPFIARHAVIESYDHIHARDGYRRRTATIHVLCPRFEWDPRLNAAHRDRGWVYWNFAAWQLKDMRLREEAVGIIIELDLETHKRRDC